MIALRVAIWCSLAVACLPGFAAEAPADPGAPSEVDVEIDIDIHRDEPPDVVVEPREPADAAEPNGSDVPASDRPAATVDLSRILGMLQSQQAELKAQRELIEKQSRDVASLRDELDALRAPPVVEGSQDTQETIASQGQPEQPIDMAGATDATAATETPEAQTETTQQVVDAQVDDPTRDTLADFVGAWRLPGTAAALRIGGFVKANVVDSFDPLATTDRFIVGSIPVGTAEPGVEAESSITANQSRLNFDLREPTNVGMLRAFIEGDFAGDGETFRLRHAFGQWNRVLAGKTWSAFVDTQATPEEVDFEGLNGRINVRQPQVRLMPHIGSQFELQLSIEDPDPSIENGDGVSRTPDLVVSGRFDWSDDLHVKVGGILRQIRGQWNGNPGNTEQKTGWGGTVSGRFDLPLFDDRDIVLFQLNAGRGIGRYVNDLNSVGEFDGRFDPVTGELDLIDVVAGYVSAQHWWGETMRSNFTAGYVQVDYRGLHEPDDYDSTLRLSGNLLWSPTPRIDLGMELLWGRRENHDGEHGDATQVQVAAKYRF